MKTKESYEIKFDGNQIPREVRKILLHILVSGNEEEVITASIAMFAYCVYDKTKKKYVNEVEGVYWLMNYIDTIGMEHFAKETREQMLSYLKTNGIIVRFINNFDPRNN
jgi:hypothetical protein